MLNEFVFIIVPKASISKNNESQITNVFLNIFN